MPRPFERVGFEPVDLELADFAELAALGELVDFVELADFEVAAFELVDFELPDFELAALDRVGFELPDFELAALDRVDFEALPADFDPFDCEVDFRLVELVRRLALAVSGDIALLRGVCPPRRASLAQSPWPTHRVSKAPGTALRADSQRVDARSAQE